MGLLDSLLNKPIWTPNPELTAAIEAHKAKAASKVSIPEPNAANYIAKHLTAIAPELVKVKNLWFSGSNVWRWLYINEGLPRPDADLDVFFVGEHRKVQKDGILGPEWYQAPDILLQDLGIPSNDSMHVPVRTGRNLDMYGLGVQALYQGRKLDIWAGGETVVETLNNYPTASHAHCRAAFSFTEGLVVLPNEAAQ